MASPPPLTELFNRLLQGRLSAAESEELIALLADEETEPQLAALVIEQLEQSRAPEEISPEIVAALEARLPAILQHSPQKAKVKSIPFFKRPWLRYSAAAVLLLAAGAWLWMHRSAPVTEVVNPKPVAVKSSDIQPGRQGAILTLDDGSTVVLDSLHSGVVASQNGSKVLLRNGQLQYNKDGQPVSTIAYNTMTTPRGRQFQLLLPDGTKVWLDAASSLRYPTAFTGNERRVEITGEAYFEVAHNAAMPFRVKIKDKPTEIEVLGTHFNVNAYPDESSINTTLLEGSVKVADGSGKAVIKPGQQAQAGGAQIKVVNGVNLQKVMAWKEGVFDFGDASLQEVMRQLERWYDIEVVYEKGVPPLEFVGKMGRDLNLSEVLRGLEVSEVHFSIEGRKLIVKP